MKPLKKIFPFPLWLFRISILLFAYVIFFDQVITFSFDGLHYYTSLAFIVFAVLLFIAGFMKKPTLTVFSSIILFLICVYELIFRIDIHLKTEYILYISFLFVSAISLIFAATGNKR